MKEIHFRKIAIALILGFPLLGESTAKLSKREIVFERIGKEDALDILTEVTAPPFPPISDLPETLHSREYVSNWCQDWS